MNPDRVKLGLLVQQVTAEKAAARRRQLTAPRRTPTLPLPWLAATETLSRDNFMSCPCGRGDYELCRRCPYPFCSVHGQTAELGKFRTQDR